MTGTPKIAVIGANGGVGTTSIAASFAALAQTAVLADCNVHDPQLHYLLDSDGSITRDMDTGSVARINETACTNCGACGEACAFSAVKKPRSADSGSYSVVEHACIGCGVCVRFCRFDAVQLEARPSAILTRADTRFGPLVYVLPAPGTHDGRSLVAAVQSEARRAREDAQATLTIMDGPSGMGSATRATVKGASAALVVSEPTRQANERLTDILALISEADIPAAVCISKHDISEPERAETERISARMGIPVAGLVRYDAAAFGSARSERQPATTAVERDGPAADDIKNVWAELNRTLLQQ